MTYVKAWPPIKEKVTVTHSTTGTKVTVVWTDGDTTVRWSAKTFAGHIDQGLADARAGARRAFEQLRKPNIKGVIEYLADAGRSAAG